MNKYYQMLYKMQHVCVCVCVCVYIYWVDFFFITSYQKTLTNFLANPIGVGDHALLQGIFSTQGLNLHLLSLLSGRQVLYH